MGRPFKIREPGEMCCPFCNRQFPNNTYLNRHICSHIKERPFMCRICGKDYIDYFTLFRHLASHEEQPQFKCGTCFKGFKTKYQLNSHKKLIHSGVARKFKCDTCGLELSSKGHLKRHISGVHLNVRSVQCSLCSLKFVDESAVKTHIVCHTGEQPFACHLCPIRFGLESNLKRHMDVHFKPSEDKRKCSICGKISSTVANLKSHMKIHNEEKSVQCQFCPRKFHKKAELKSHMTIHTGERYYSCSMCKIQLKTAIAKFAHEKKNNCWMQSLVCVFCNKDFRKVKEPGKPFRVHIRKHIEERPYICTKCPQEFIDNAGLRVHMRKYHIPTLKD